MQVGRLVGLIVGWFVLVTAARPAAACGRWTMVDKEKHADVSWLINSGTIKKGTRRTGALYLDDARDGQRVVIGKRVVLDIVQGAIRKKGRAIGAVEAGGAIRIGKTTYTVEFSNPSDYHDMSAWTVTVKRGADVIVVSEQAVALCAPMHRDPPMSEADQQGEIRRRIAYYLTWRDVGL